MRVTGDTADLSRGGERQSSAQLIAAPYVAFMRKKQNKSVRSEGDFG